MTELDRLADRDDVLRSAQTIPVDPGSFETVRENVAAGRDRWVGAVVRDRAGRIVLVRNRWSDGWVLPGGTVETDETLRDAAVREVREETGLDATVERPLEVVEQTFVADGSGVDDEDTTSGHFVVFEARADEGTLGDDLGADGDEIAAAAWFDSVPEECEYADLVARHR